MAGDVALAARVRAASLLSGRFRLRSGRISSTYFDKYRVESDPVLLAELVAAMRPLVPARAEVLAGLEMGGIPLVTLLSAATGLPARFVRKQAKDYCTGRVAEGGAVADREVVLVEDVVTSGGAVLAAAAVLRAQSARVRHVLCAIDRQEGGRHRLAESGLRLHAAFTRIDLDICAGEGGEGGAGKAPAAAGAVPVGPAPDGAHLVTVTADQAAELVGVLQAAAARLDNADPDATGLAGRARALARQLHAHLPADHLPADRVTG